MDRDYYRQRLKDELDRAYTADCEPARAAHRTLAEFYRRKLTEPEPPRYRRGRFIEPAA